jgi:hypothetical protein
MMAQQHRQQLVAIEPVGLGPPGVPVHLHAAPPDRGDLAPNRSGFLGNDEPGDESARVAGTPNHGFILNRPQEAPASREASARSHMS